MVRRVVVGELLDVHEVVGLQVVWQREDGMDPLVHGLVSVHKPVFHLFMAYIAFERVIAKFIEQCKSARLGLLGVIQIRNALAKLVLVLVGLS